MDNLIEAQNTIRFLKGHGISAKKRYGQNFLIDKRVLGRIIEGAEINKDDVVLEIGPGIGTLTQALCGAAGQVIAVEIDKDMMPLLGENLAGYRNYEIINADVLKLDLGEMLAQKGVDAGKRIKVAANLPYYITTPIIMQLLESRLPLSSITVMVQKEVADRMQAVPGGRDYGALTLAVQYYSEPKVICNVPPNSFIPRPGVDSAVIRLDCYEEPKVGVKDEERFFAIIRAAFGERRKTLVNALRNVPALGISRETAEAALNKMGLDMNIRGERLTIQQFALLAELL